MSICPKSSKYGANTEHFLKIQVLREKSRNTEPLTALCLRAAIKVGISSPCRVYVSEAKDCTRCGEPCAILHLFILAHKLPCKNLSFDSSRTRH